jgi:hypothetical protein
MWPRQLYSVYTEKHSYPTLKTTPDTEETRNVGKRVPALCEPSQHQLWGPLTGVLHPGSRQAVRAQIEIDTLRQS